MQCPKCSSSNIHRTSPEQCVCRDCLNVFESQVTEKELPKKTPVKAIKKKDMKDKNKSLKMFAWFIGIALTLGFLNEIAKLTEGESAIDFDGVDEVLLDLELYNSEQKNKELAE